MNLVVTFGRITLPFIRGVSSPFAQEIKNEWEARWTKAQEEARWIICWVKVGPFWLVVLSCYLYVDAFSVNPLVFGFGPNGACHL